MQNQQFKNFLAVDQRQERQIVVAVPCLFHDEERASILRIILLKREAIEDVKVNLDDDAVIIKFDSKVLSKKDLFNLLDDILANFSEKPREKIKKTAGECPRCGGVEKEIVFCVEGMSCASCALFLEMTLVRDEKVTRADIDFKSKKGVVIGCVSQADVFDIVERHGYKARSIGTE